MSKALFPGEKLRARREELGLTLSQVHENIRVPLEYIRALEDGVVDRLPTYAYSAGFINSYCLFLNLPPEPFLDYFRSATHRRQQTSTAYTETYAPSALMDRIPRAPWMADLIAWGTICGILMLSWLAYSTIIKPFAEAGEARVEAGSVPAVKAPMLHFPEEDAGSY